VKPPQSVALGPVAAEILTYLSARPNRADTVEGIAEWWLLEQRVRRMICEVKHALAELAAAGFVLEITGRDGRFHYRLNTRRRKSIAKRLENMSHRIARQPLTNG